MSSYLPQVGDLIEVTFADDQLKAQGVTEGDRALVAEITSEGYSMHLMWFRQGITDKCRERWVRRWHGFKIVRE